MYGPSQFRGRYITLPSHLSGCRWHPASRHKGRQGRFSLGRQHAAFRGPKFDFRQQQPTSQSALLGAQPTGASQVYLWGRRPSPAECARQAARFLANRRQAFAKPVAADARKVIDETNRNPDQDLCADLTVFFARRSDPSSESTRAALCAEYT